MRISPVLTAKYDHAIAYAVNQLLQNKLDLIYSSDAGKSALTVGAQHDVIRQIYRKDNRLLQH